MGETRYAIRTSIGLLGKSYPDLDSAKLDAQGFLLSRSREKKAEVVPLMQDVIGGVGPAVCVVTRKKPGGPLTWRDIETE